MSKFDDLLEEELKKRKKKEEEEKYSSLTSGKNSYLPSYGSAISPVWKEYAPITTTVRSDDDDIAPVEERTWFKAGAFDDGYDGLGDVAITVMASGKDLIENVAAGIIGMGEKAVDAGAYLVGGAGKLLGADDFADDTKEFIKRNWIDEERVAKGLIDPFQTFTDSEKFSVFGENTDSLVQSGGQLLATAGLQSIGVPWFVTSGVTSFGGEVENAFNQGASYAEAGVSAAISAGAEILTEKLFGGSGLGEKGLINFSGLTKGISNKVVKVLADYGLDVAAEGSEEVISQVFSNLGSALYKEENLGEILFSEEAVDGYIESFVGGAALGGIANVGNINTSIKTGRDYRTKLTDNETKVFNKVYEDAIANAEKDGEKLTKNEKSKIYDDVMKQLERGYIDSDIVEEVLGGDNYTAYKQSVDSENALKSRQKELQQEYDALNKMKQGDMTGEQVDRREELRQNLNKIRHQLSNKATKNQQQALKDQLSKSVYGSLTRQVGKNVQTDNYLLESYNEKARRGEDFKADFDKFKGAKHSDAANKTLENAMKAGANNANRTHDIVDFAAKVAGDTGRAFDFQTNEQIKADFIERQTKIIEKLESIANRNDAQNKRLEELKAQLEKVISGKATVNGNITANGIVLNLSSANPLNRVVGHEVTHIFEPEKGKQVSDEYTSLKDALYRYAKSKGEDIDKKLAEYELLYEGIEGTTAEAEMIADMVGEYLFDDTDFAYHLSVHDQNVFQRVWNEIKHLAKIATAGSKEARELERVKKAFEDAYRKSSEGKEFGDSDVQYSIRKEAPPKNTGIAYKVFFVKDGKLYPPMVANPDGADTPMGVWLNADMGVAAPPSKTGRAQVKAGGKGTQGGSGSLAFRPGWHLGDLPRASQFDRVNPETGKKELFPENFVWAEVEYAKDVDYQEEAMSYGYTENGKFRHAYAGLPRLPENGYYRYRTNPNPDTVPWVITGAMKVNRLLSDAEVNQILAENGVEPVHRQGGDVGLDKFGFNEDGTVKYSLSDQTDMRFTPAEIQTIQSIGRKSINSFNSQDIAATEKFARRYWQEIGTKSPFYRAWFGDWRVKDTTPIQVATQRGDTRTEHTNKDTGWSIRNSRVVHNETTSHKSLMNREAVPYLPYIDEIIANAVLLDTEGVGKPKSENSLLMHYLYAVADVGNGPEVLKLTVEEMYNPGTKGANKRAYTLQNIEKAFTASGRVQGNSPSSGTNTANAVRTVADLFSLVKSYDKNFAPNASSKIVNADGTPKVMYHGSPAQFTVFDKNKAKSSGHYGKGFYFTDSTSHAGTYGNQYNVYLNIRNPLQSGGDMVSRSQVRKFLEAVAENEDYSIENYGTYDVDAVLNNVMGQDKAADAFRIIQDINATAIGDMVEATELFNSVNGTEFDGIVVPTETVAFYPEQIKSATDNIGTFDKSNPDIRYSLSDTEGRQLSNEQAEYFKDSVVRDENGNLKVMYHGTANGGYTVFNTYGSKYGLFGVGSYFTDSKTIAESYTEKYNEQGNDNKQVYETYLNITNPMDMDAQADPVQWQKAFPEASFPESGTNEEFYRAMEEYFYDEMYHKWEASEAAVETIMGMGYDGITHIGGGRVNPNGERHQVYIAFHPEQIKNTDNVKPTGDADIRYSLSEDADGKKLSNEQQEFFKDSVIRDADGKLVPMYHGTTHGGFTVFDGGKDYWYFTNDKKYAYTFEGRKANGQLYPSTKEGMEKGHYNPERYKVYLDVKNPFVTDDVDIIEDALYWDKSLAGNLRAKGYDALMLADLSQVIVLNANQIKNVSNKKPTADPDIRYSLSDNEGNPLTEEQVYFFKDSKIRDKEGNLRRVYHTTKNDFTVFDKNRRGEATDGANTFLGFFFAESPDHMEQFPEFQGGRTDAYYLDMKQPMDLTNLSREAFMDIVELTGGDRTEAGEVYDQELEAEKARARLRGDNNTSLSIGQLLYNMVGDYYHADFFDALKPNYDQLVAKGYDGVIDYLDEMMGEREFVVFDSNQAKLASNTNPTDDPDIRSSLSNGNKGFTPIRPNEFFGDKFLKETAPVAETVSEAESVVPAEDIAPVVEQPKKATPKAEYESIKPKKTQQPKMVKVETARQKTDGKIGKVVMEREVQNKTNSGIKWAKEHIFRHGAVFEDLSLKTGNRELQARFDMIRRAESRAQTFIGKGKGKVSALVDVRNAIEKSGKTKAFNYYLYHMHNVDRMTLEQRFEDTQNKAVFGYDVTAEMSKQAAARLLKANPEFKRYADEIYGINKHLRQMLVDEGVISKETAELWETMYPHYVPISRVGHDGLNVNVPLDSNRTGVNAPIKKATGGNSDFYNVFDTMGSRIQQTFKAVAKNRFGVELKNTLGTTIESEATDMDSVLDSMDQHEELLQEGKNGQSPTFTVFENGERVKFEITEEMYEAMKPSQFTYTNEILNKVGNARRDILTTYSPLFAITNPLKDVQDVFLNSQHSLRTYATMPEAIKSVLSKDHWYQERMENGGAQDSYFDGQTKTFKKEKSQFQKVMGFPFEKIQQVNEVIEQIPRMAEYIASRKMGRSIDVSMLDAARVTTNFGAPGDLTNMLNRNGFTFLGASMEGFNQQVRNVREAKAEGMKGWAKLAGKTLAVGLSAMLLNHLLWDDDEEYEELSDYVKQNYYVIAKTEEGRFIRIPKGRAVSVIQDAFQQMSNMITGNDEVDLGAFAQLVVNNLAPNNPLDNNIFAPIGQALTNKTWYGDDLVPTRLQDLPAAEQFDETTDSISKWLGELTNTSPYKWNYLLDQYSGGVGDILLPYLTPEADGGGLGAAFRDKFSTDPVLKNQNVSDFYDKVDELTTNAKSSNATDEDVLKYKYMNSVNSELSKLYAEKRAIQNDMDMTDAEKYEAVRDIQQQIVDLARESLNTYDKVEIQGNYARVGNLYYRLNDSGEWQKLTDKQVEKQDKVTSGLDIAPTEYWDNKEEYDYAYEHPENYAVAKAVGGYESYMEFAKKLDDIKANKDQYGKSIMGSRKEKVIEYFDTLDADYGAKLIMFKKEYPADDTYNEEIIEYLNNREDISYEDMVAILKELGFAVSSDGTVTWD